MGGGGSKAVPVAWGSDFFVILKHFGNSKSNSYQTIYNYIGTVPKPRYYTVPHQT